jgi:hypothetical protein
MTSEPGYGDSLQVSLKARSPWNRSRARTGGFDLAATAEPPCAHEAQARGWLAKPGSPSMLVVLCSTA